jgi:hypothetical protein
MPEERLMFHPPKNGVFSDLSVEQYTRFVEHFTDYPDDLNGLAAIMGRDRLKRFLAIVWRGIGAEPTGH